MSKRYKRLIILANWCDSIGWYKDANELDSLVKAIKPTKNCVNCDRSLARSLWSPDYSTKTCPHCSENAGEHIFYTLDKFRQAPSRGSGIESWCSGCDWYGKDTGLGGLDKFTPASIDCTQAVSNADIPVLNEKVKQMQPKHKFKVPAMPSAPSGYDQVAWKKEWPERVRDTLLIERSRINKERALEGLEPLNIDEVKDVIAPIFTVELVLSKRPAAKKFY